MPLYRVTEGPLLESSYGLKLAGLLPLPVDVLTHAKVVSDALTQKTLHNQSRGERYLTQRRKRLLLDLYEHLRQAGESKISDDGLREWLEDLRKEFVIQMTAASPEGSSCTSEQGQSFETYSG